MLTGKTVTIAGIATLATVGAAALAYGLKQDHDRKADRRTQARRPQDELLADLEELAAISALLEQPHLRSVSPRYRGPLAPVVIRVI